MTLTERLQWLRTCTARERKEYEHAVKCLPCVANGCGKSPCDKHHAFGVQWPATKEWRPLIALCKEHHQGNTGIHGKIGKRPFEATHGSQRELVEKTEKLLQGKI